MPCCAHTDAKNEPTFPMIWVGFAIVILVLGGLFIIWRSSVSDNMLIEGVPAPAFALLNQSGETIDSKSLTGSWYVIYFYPKDGTPGCTKEACSFRDHLHELQVMGMRILGVSFDDVASHKAFAEKYHLSFDLLADPEGTVIRAYGAASAIPGFARRVSYLVDDAGVIRQTYPNVTPSEHAAGIIRDVKALQAR